MVEAGWSRKFVRETDSWLIISLGLAGNDPLRAKQFRACTYTEIATAWQNKQRNMEGVGYKTKRR